MTNFVANAPFDYPAFLAESSLTEFFNEAVPTEGTGTSFVLTNTFVENSQQITEQLTLTGTFANYVDGYPTTGSITAMTYTSTEGTSFTFTSVVMTVEVFTSYVQAGDLEALMVDLLAGNDSVTGSGGSDVLVAYSGHDALRGNEGNDSLSGGAGNDFLVGGGGDDVIDGGDGIDRASLFDGTGSFGITVDLRLDGIAQDFGPLGIDTLTSIEHVTATYGHDTIHGNEAGNWFWTFAGLDQLWGYGGGDYFTVGYGDKVIDGGAGSDTVEIDDTDAFDPLYTADGITVSLALQGQAQAVGVGNWTLTGIENLSGNFGSDDFTGNDNANVLAGAGGDDTLRGGGGDDILMGDGAMVFGSPLETNTYAFIPNIFSIGFDIVEGNDVLEGGAGNDTIHGGGGHDVLRGGADSDTLNGDAGDDFLVGGAGNDVIDGGAGIDRVSLFDDGTGGFGITVDLRLDGVAQDFGPLGIDTLSGIEHVNTTYNDDTVHGNEAGNWIWTYAGFDQLWGHGGDDLFTVGYGDKIIDGGDGSDTVEIDDQAWVPHYTADGITVSLELQGQAQATGVGNWTLTVIENLSGNYGADKFTGDGNANILAGFGGNDILRGGAGNDILMGDGAITLGEVEGSPGSIVFLNDLGRRGFAITEGDDILEGGAGDDQLYGDGGNDFLDGGAGFDTAIFNDVAANYSWTLSGGATHVQGSDGADTLRGVERMEFTDATYELRLTGIGEPTLLTASFGAGASAGGWASQSTYPRTLADVNGDGLADVVGFGEGGVYTALANGNGSFAEAFLAFGGYGAGASAGGWSDNDVYPRTLADVNGDGMDDLIGFGEGGVYVSVATGGGSFGQAFLAFGGYGAGPSAGGWSDNDVYPRMLADVNGDGMDDLVGFGDGGVQISLATGGGSFGTAVLGIAGFGAGASAGGWSSNDVYTRTLADINGDGRADVVGFGSGGVQVALANEDGTFANPFFAFAGFGAEASAGGWTSNDLYYRTVGDIDGDGNADLIGFGDGGVYAAYGDGAGGFATAELVIAGFGAGSSAGGWASSDLYPRLLADLNGDGVDDIVGFGDGGVIAATSVSEWLLV